MPQMDNFSETLPFNLVNELKLQNSILKNCISNIEISFSLTIYPLKEYFDGKKEKVYVQLRVLCKDEIPKEMFVEETVGIPENQKNLINLKIRDLLNESKDIKNISCDICKFISSYAATTDEDSFASQDGILESKPKTHDLFKDHFIRLETLGSGAFGKVIKAHRKFDEQEYAIKQVKLNGGNTRREAVHLARLNHINVVRYYYSWFEICQFGSRCSSYSSFDSGISSRSSKVDSKNSDLALCIQMELCEQSTLEDRISKRLYLDKNLRWRYFMQILSGLNHIHSKKILHRDLKPANIFIVPEKIIKIGDFGLSESFEKPCKVGSSGTPIYQPPEVSNDKLVDCKPTIDIYSLGMILFMMCSKIYKTRSELIEIVQLLKSRDIIFPENFAVENEKEVNIIQQCLNHDFDKRPSAEELLKDLSE